MTAWSPEKYLAFEAERTRPVRDLLAAVPAARVRHAADIGCGPGNSTEVLAEKYPDARVVGLDSSAEMLAAARLRLPHVQFRQADIARWDGNERFDLILANAVLQWVPDHATLLPRLLGRLSPGGTLALQMPDNQNEPSHRLMREIAASGPWAAKLRTAAAARTAIAPAAWFHALLLAHDAWPTIWTTTYFQPLPGGTGAIVDWFASTGLRPFLAPLDEAERLEFLARYRAALAPHYEQLPTGEVLFPSPRLFIVATLRNPEP